MPSTPVLGRPVNNSTRDGFRFSVQSVEVDGHESLVCIAVRSNNSRPDNRGLIETWKKRRFWSGEEEIIIGDYIADGREWRALEYMISRYCAKLLVSLARPVVEGDMREIQVTRDTSGVPVLSLGPSWQLCDGENEPSRISINETRNGPSPGFFTQGMFISVSHSRDLIAVAVSEDAIGIDVEKIRERDPSWSKRSFQPGEIALAIRAMPQGHQPARETFLWVVKEAAIKAMNVSVVLSKNSISHPSKDELGRRHDDRVDDDGNSRHYMDETRTDSAGSKKLAFGQLQSLTIEKIEKDETGFKGTIRSQDGRTLISWRGTLDKENAYCFCIAFTETGTLPVV